MTIPAEEDKWLYHDRQLTRLEALYETLATKADIARLESQLSGFATRADIASLEARIERNSKQDFRYLVGFIFAIVSIGVAIIKWL